MNIASILVGLIIAALVYVIAGLFLPHVVALLLALLVLVLAITGYIGPPVGGRRL